MPAFYKLYENPLDSAHFSAGSDPEVKAHFRLKSAKKGLKFDYFTKLHRAMSRLKIS